MNKLLKAIFVSAIFALVSMTSPPVYSDEADVAKSIAAAETKADHETLARHYRTEAQALQAKVEEEKNMSKAYKNLDGGKGVDALAKHCDKLVSYYEDAVKENQELAKLHHKLAAKARK